MRPSSLTAFTIIIMVFLTACGGEPEEQAETTTEPTTSAEPTTAATGNQPADGEQKSPDAPSSQEFNNPMEPGNDPTSIGDLLTATNPEDRQKQVEQEIRQDRNNRSNPFGAPTVKPPPIRTDQYTTRSSDNFQPREVPSLPRLPEIFVSGAPASTGKSLPPRQVPQLPSLPSSIGPAVPPGGNGAIGLPQQNARQVPQLPGLPSSIGPAVPPGGVAIGLPQQNARQVPQLPGLPSSIGPAVPDGGSIGLPPEKPRQVPQLPGVPRPIGPVEVISSLAELVEITGVIEVGNQIQIILKAPNEATSRYVKVGEKIVNGQVLVKRVEKAQGVDPVVILEQDGVEYRKVVGQKLEGLTDN